LRHDGVEPGRITAPVMMRAAMAERSHADGLAGQADAGHVSSVASPGALVAANA